MRDLGGRTVYGVVGPTASGKGRLARALAVRHDMEIISLDSMKVYRGMDIGTAKPSRKARETIPHHGIDVTDPREIFDLACWIDSAEEAVLSIVARGRKPLLVGGTGLYLMGFLHGIFEAPKPDPALRKALETRVKEDGSPALHAELCRRDPEAGRRIHPSDARRIVRALEVLETTGEPVSHRRTQWGIRRRDVESRLVGLHRPSEALAERIDARLERMMASGFLDEVRALLAPGKPGRGASQAVGYSELIAHLEGAMDLEEALRRIRRNTRRLARRQRTWFRRFEDIHWIEVSGEADAPAVLREAEEALGLVG